MSRDWDCTGFDVGVTHIPPGITLAILVNDPAYTVGGSISYVAGGTLILMKAPNAYNGLYGMTYTGATLAAHYAAGAYYVIGQTPLNYNGAARYYIGAIGATATLQYVKGLSPGYPAA